MTKIANLLSSPEVEELVKLTETVHNEQQVQRMRELVAKIDAEEKQSDESDEVKEPLWEILDNAEAVIEDVQMTPQVELKVTVKLPMKRVKTITSIKDYISEEEIDELLEELPEMKIIPLDGAIQNCFTAYYAGGKDYVVTKYGTNQMAKDVAVEEPKADMLYGFYNTKGELVVYFDRFGIFHAVKTTDNVENLDNVLLLAENEITYAYNRIIASGEIPYAEWIKTATYDEEEAILGIAVEVEGLIGVMDFDPIVFRAPSVVYEITNTNELIVSFGEATNSNPIPDEELPEDIEGDPEYVIWIDGIPFTSMFYEELAKEEVLANYLVNSETQDNIEEDDVEAITGSILRIVKFLDLIASEIIIRRVVSKRSVMNVLQLFEKLGISFNIHEFRDYVSM